MDVSNHFSESYREARTKFLEAARARSATLETHCHPLHQDPSGEDLSVDVALLGDASSERVMMIVSGTHGVEGYAGSACQVNLLKSDFCTELAASTRVILVHAINPYGFAYTRRTNEDNIDLNRNFVDFSQQLPRNPNYAECARAFLPAGAMLEDYQQARARMDQEASARGGYEFLKKALQPGQYEFPNGLFYGGREPAWSNVIFTQICRQAFASAERAAVLDIHTGLGPSGVGELIFMTQESGSKYAQSFTPPVSTAGAQGSVSSSVKGPLVSAACDQIRARVAICCALEFGTVPLRENVEAKIFENWTYRHLSADHPMRQESTRKFKDAYFCDNPVWKMNVIERSNEVVKRLHECLSAK